MTAYCTDRPKWKDELLNAALAGAPSAELKVHLSNCSACAAELAALRARREKMDSLLPLVAQAADPPADFRACVLAATAAADESNRRSSSVTWQLAAVAAVILIALVVGFTLHRRNTVRVPETELAAAQQLADWRAPSDALLALPGPDVLRSIPKLGDSYLQLPPVAPENAARDAAKND
jgi:anti-sigma factor RsiW